MATTLAAQKVERVMSFLTDKTHDDVAIEKLKNVWIQVFDECVECLRKERKEKESDPFAADKLFAGLGNSITDVKPAKTAVSAPATPPQETSSTSSGDTTELYDRSDDADVVEARSRANKVRKDNGKVDWPTFQKAYAVVYKYTGNGTAIPKGKLTNTEMRSLAWKEYKLLQ